MASHPKVEMLSTFLDEALADAERQRVERHLEDCSPCRERLQGMERIVRRLETLMRSTPPPFLGEQIQQAVVVRRRRRSRLLAAVESATGRIQLQSPLFPAFAVMLALILIVYLLSWGLAPRVTTERDIGGETESLRSVAGRVFEYRGGVWVEHGLGTEPPVSWLSAESQQFREWVEADPQLNELELLGRTVRLEMDGRVVEVFFPER